MDSNEVGQKGNNMKDLQLIQTEADLVVLVDTLDSEIRRLEKLDRTELSNLVPSREDLAKSLLLRIMLRKIQAVTLD